MAAAACLAPLTTFADTAPLARWALDELSGLTAADSSGNGLTAALVNMQGSEWTNGVHDGGLLFGAAGVTPRGQTCFSNDPTGSTPRGQTCFSKHV